jgi:hypothetical protein
MCTGDFVSGRVGAGDLISCGRASEAVDESVGVAIEEDIFAGTDVPLLITGIDRAGDMTGLNKGAGLVSSAGGVGFDVAANFGPWLRKVGEVGTLTLS